MRIHEVTDSRLGYCIHISPFFKRYYYESAYIKIDVPSGIYIDLNKLEIAANEFIQKYIGQMVLYDAENNVETKRTHSFRKLRGVMSSDKPYKEMLEDALKEKYSI